MLADVARMWRNVARRGEALAAVGGPEHQVLATIHPAQTLVPSSVKTCRPRNVSHARMCLLADSSRTGVLSCDVPVSYSA
jgi:hypothetical protein